MKEEKISITYYETCGCGRKFKVGKNSEQVACSKCRERHRVEEWKCRDAEGEARAREALAFMIGATIIDIECSGSGEHADASEIESLKAITSQGRTIEFTVGGYDEHYIEWDSNL